jgi:hypothetical protein
VCYGSQGNIKGDRAEGKGGKVNMKPHVWVIEMLLGDKWEATVGTGISKKDALMFMRAEWKSNNPDDKFRVVKYVREKEGT